MPPPPPPIPSPPALTARLGTPAPTMPGSLFPRSASLMPETPIVQRAVPRPRTPTPPPEPIAEEAEEDEVVEEQPRESPSRGRSQDRYSAKFRDKRPETSEPSSVRERSRQSESSERAASSSRRSLDEPEHAEPVARLRSSKGKERACDTSGEIRVRGKERELREAKENHARYAHERDDGERERDKQRIRMLEEEVARLRAELALKTNGAMMPPPPPPPPPPPLFRPVAPTASSGNTDNFLASARASLKPTAPPVEAPINTAYSGARAKKAGIPTVNVPSDKMAAFLREMKNVRLRRVGGLTGNASMGPPMSTAGDVAADTGVSDRSMDAGRMSRARMAATLGERSFDLGVAARLEIGQKRKRDAVEESSAGPSKRRETTFLRQEDTGASRSSQSSASSSQSSASSSAPSSSSRTSSFDMPPPRSQPSRPRLNAPLRIWPTRTSTADTDLTTPSLCSDNENDHEHDDKLPDTPSDSGRGRSGAKAAAVVRQPPPRSQPEREVIDVDALETPPKRLPSPKSPVGEKKGLFARRPPVSPLPASAMSPNKPKPPGRTAKSKIPLALPRRVPRIDDASESDDDQGPPATTLSMTQTTRGLSESVRDEASRPGPSRMRRGSSASSSIRGGSQSREARPESRMSNHARRRLTLDEELRRAGDSLWQPSDEEEQDAPGEEAADEPEVDSGELVALGTRSSKRGFLAGGGGAGPPVFMGEGYVQGVVAEERSRTRSRSGTSEGSRSRAYAGEGSRRRR
ncbi:hypothetical protein C8Q70DRAFT_906152 [Cubamyces menziesii]|nr:hypothetical protein C8Q70DRAFT_906152 [Cubamyces menziesii]